MVKMSKRKKAQYLGKAAESRVISELLLRGHNPAPYQLDMGIDIQCHCGLKYQVKSGRLREIEESPGRFRTTIGLTRSIWKEGKRHEIPASLEGVDFLIAWLPDTDDFYIIPAKLVHGKHNIRIYPASNSSKWNRYRNAWQLLEEDGEGSLDEFVNER